MNYILVIFFDLKKMNVRNIAQTLRDSFASSLKFCLNEKISGFEGCESTIKFYKYLIAYLISLIEEVSRHLIGNPQ